MKDIMVSQIYKYYQFGMESGFVGFTVQYKSNKFKNYIFNFDKHNYQEKINELENLRQKIIASLNIDDN